MLRRRASHHRSRAQRAERAIERLESRLAFAAVTLEAENATLSGVSRSAAVSGYGGTGYVTGFDDALDRVTWSSFTATPGSYRMAVRFRSPFGDKGFEGALNGVAFSGTFQQSAGFATFDRPTPCILEAGGVTTRSTRSR